MVMSQNQARDLAKKLQENMLKFIDWFKKEKSGRNPVRWNLLLWDIAVSPQPAHDNYPDAKWPAWRLYRFARGFVGQHDEITERAVLRGFKSKANVYTEISRTFRDSFDAYTQNSSWCCSWANCDISLMTQVAQAGEKLSDAWSSFREKLAPAEVWEDLIVSQLKQCLSSYKSVLAMAYYPSSYSEFLAAVALNVREKLGIHNPSLQVNIVSSWEESLGAAVQSLNPASGSLLIVPVHGTAAFPDLEDGLKEAVSRQLHMLVFCPDADTNERITKVHLHESYGRCEILLSPWYQPDTAVPEVPQVPHEVVSVQQRTGLLNALACFSVLHRKPTLEQLVVLSGMKQEDILTFITNTASDWIQYDESTTRAYWGQQDGSVLYLEQQFSDLENLSGQYVSLILKLSKEKPNGWETVTLNLLKSMYQTGRLRLLRRILKELDKSGKAPEKILGVEGPVGTGSAGPGGTAAPATALFQTRLDLARVYARAYLHVSAHQLLVHAEPRPGNEFIRHQLCCAEILADQLADTGKKALYEAASFIYADLSHQFTPLMSQSAELRAHLELVAGNPAQALNLVNNSGNQLSMYGQAIKARALAELGRVDQALQLQGKTSMPRGFQLDRLALETQSQFEQRWASHVQLLLGAPAERTPAEALHQMAIRALERGHLATAHNLIEHARSHYRDNVYLATAHARLLVEAGRCDEAVRFLLDLRDQLTGKQHLVVQGALADALLELWRSKNGSISNERKQKLDSILMMLEKRLREENYLPSQWARVKTLLAKAWWYGAWGQDKTLNPVIAELSNLNSAPALALAARILAANCAIDDALDKLSRAFNHAADPQTRIRLYNTKARILLDRAAAGDVLYLSAVDCALKESEALDEGNSYTMLLRAEWCEGRGGLARAQNLKQKAGCLRKI